MVEKKLQNRFSKVIEKSLSNEGTTIQTTIVDNRKPISKIRFGSGGPAKVTSMKKNLDASKKPVEVKVCKYVADQWRFFDAYFEESVKTGFLNACVKAKWQAAPHLFPKGSKSRFKTTIDLQPRVLNRLLFYIQC